MTQNARAYVVMLETSWGGTVDVVLATDDMSVGDLEARGMAAWEAMHDRTYEVCPTGRPWVAEMYIPRTRVDWSPA